MNKAVGNKKALMNVFTEMMNTSSHIKDYNFRSYFLRRTAEVSHIFIEISSFRK